MRRVNLISGSLIFILGLVLYFVIIPLGIKVGEATGGLSPRFFPNLSSLILTALGALLFLVNIRFSSVAEPSGRTKPLSWSNVANIVLLTALSMGVVAMFKYIGYFITAPILVGSLMVIYGGLTHWLRILLTALGGPFLLYVFAWGVFGTPLP